jgi:hypothetical protein
LRLLCGFAAWREILSFFLCVIGIGLERWIQKGKISRKVAKSPRRLLGGSVGDARDAALDQGHYEVHQ